MELQSHPGPARPIPPDTNYLLFLADQQVEVSGTKYNVFKCIRYERITDYSYKYYIYNDLEINAGNVRLIIEKYDPSVYSFNLSALCNPSSPPTVEEFHMIVKKGHENSVGQWCPTFLLGEFSYTHNTGSVVTCNTASNLDVCANWTTLTFDYAKCPTVQAFSAEGTVDCLYTQAVGSVSYVSVLNKGTVDYSAYERFTCLAFENTGSIIKVSDSAGSCNVGQSPTVKQPDGSGTLELTPKQSCYGNCSLPNYWDSSWIDSGHGQITFNQSDARIVSGWSVTVYGTTVSSWTCQASNVSSSSDSGYSLFKADTTVSSDGKKYNVFRCIEWTKITNNSFYYYIQQDENALTNNERYFVEEHNPYVNSWDLEVYCQPTTPPPPEEYHVLVQQGYETSVKQWCPVPLRATFTYVHNDGATSTCGGGSSLSLCPDWSTMTFDYNLCSTEQAFSKEGNVHCVHSVFDGTAFHTTLINPGDVSQSSHHRFSCFTIKKEGSTIFMSDSEGSCTKGQDAKIKQNDGSGTLTLTSNSSCYGACSFPPLWDGEWYDSLHGDVTFNSTLSTVTGWAYTAYNQLVTPFTCVSENTTSNQLLFIGDQKINVFSSLFNVFVCIRWIKITDYSYYFYVPQDVEPNIKGKRRAIVRINNPSVTSFSTADYCKADNAGPDIEEYHVLVKKGYEASTVQWCPTPLLGRFNYVHNDGTSDSCSASSELQVCPSWTRMTFDYTKCSTKQAFSNEGVVDCVQTIKKDETYFTTVLNIGSVDYANYYRFSCLAITVSDGLVYMSDSKGSCEANQTSTVKQTDGSGTLVLTKQESCYGNCVFPSTWNSTWYDSSMGDVIMSNSSSAITSGWTVTAYSVPVTSWTCVSENTTDSIMLFKGDQVVEVSPGVKKNVFRCIQWKRISDESYFYYIKHDLNSDAQNRRIGVGGYDPSVTSFDISTYCTPTSPPGVEEFHMLVKEGAGPEIRQWCPNAFLGKSSYTHNTGSSQTCASSSELSTCSDWRTMIFDYTKCSTVQAFSSEGTVHCVNTIQSGSTFYTSLYNPGTVDGTSFHRFTCFASSVSPSGILVSDSVGSCQMNQSPTTKATDGSGTLTVTQNQNCYGSCSLPSSWDGKWYDSGLGDIIFSHSSHNVQGWPMTVNGQTVTSWTCQTQRNTDNLLLFKADQIIEVNGVMKNVFRCIKWTNITDNSYHYYVFNDVESNAGNQRVKIEDHDPSVQSWNISDYCTPTSAPVTEEYHVIVKEGQESSVKQWCPIPLISNFTYTHNDGSTTSCSASSALSVCPSWNTLTFDYSNCSTEQIFSKEGVGYCVQTITKGNTFYTSVLNPGDVTGVGHHRFTCLAISLSGSQIQISDSAGSCEAGQTATVKASDGSGLLTLTSSGSCYGNCTFPLDFAGTWHDSRTDSVEFVYDHSRVSLGWAMTISNNTVSSWTCMSDDTNSQLLLLKSDTILEINGLKKNAFMCIDWKKITSNSYRYYIKNDENPNASSERVSIEDHDPFVTDWNINSYCNPSNGPAIEQFHMIVKQGQETTVKQWCPNPLLGTFFYTIDNGTTQTCGNGSRVDVCATWTTMTFDYTKCSSEVLSKEGEVYCLYTIISGSTYYTSVLNPGFVDQTNYHRFTCLAVTADANSDNVFVSESAGSCERDQQSTVQQPDGKANYTFTPYSTCHGSCTFPIQWESIWHDSDKGSIEIQAPSKSVSPGWSATAYSKTVTSWTCHAEDTNQNLLLFKSDHTVENAGVQYNLFKCIKWREITPYSHFYYVQNDVNSNALNERVFIELYDPSVTSWNTTTYCNPSSPPKLEEYHIMVKQGFESQAAQPCPPALIGRFTYTHDSGSTQTCSSSSSLAVCPSWDTMTFDYTKCSTEQAFSKEGVVKCLMFLSSGATVFTSVLNPGDVTDSRHTVFTCYALTRSNDTIYMSDKKGSCAPGQTPNVKQTAGSGTLTMEVLDSCIDKPTGSSVGLCTLPTNWDGDWYDSGMGEIQMSERTKSVTSGWDVSVSTTSLTSWSCVTSNDTGSYLLFKSDQLVDYNGTFYNAFRCIQWTKITYNSYMYYPMTDEESLASNTRIKLELYDPTKVQWDTSIFCSPTIPPDTEQFYILVKKGQESQVKQWCPSPLLATFTYKHLTANGTETCTGVSSLDVCTNRTIMAFDYTKCSTTQAFSSEGVVYCVKSLVVNGVYYTMVLNPGTVDNTFYHRFTCLATTKTGGVVFTTDRPSMCAKNQSSTTVVQGGSGTLEMIPEETCDFTTNVDESKPGEGIATGSVIGAVVGILLILIIAAVVGCIVFKYIKRKKTQHNDTQQKKPMSDEDTPRALHYNVEEMKKNFALPPLQHAAPSLSRVSPKISPKVQSLDLPPPSHLPPVPVSTSTPAKPKKKKKHRRDKKHNNEDSHIDQSNGSVPKPDVISGTSAIELEDYDEAIADILATVDN
nr:uncharacterized protein LOC105330858 isoform X2 [Crassostrea gigas]